MQVTSSSATEYSGEANDAQQGKDALAPLWSPRIVYIRADITHLASPLIPFAVFKDNPLLSFHAARETHRPFAQLENAAEVVELLWNQPFSALTDTQRYFLVAWSAVPRHSSRLTPLAELTFGIATPGPYYKRWLTSRAVRYHGEPVAWRIEIDMLGEQEKVIEIVLTARNMQRLLPAQVFASGMSS
ncbi:MAG TPA: hypothetical protein VFQ36_05575 [Ktedonobacteraceae bacterium]|nr:hypothetical protein [Ktedonobacteraceae bacterium]